MVDDYRKPLYNTGLDQDGLLDDDGAGSPGDWDIDQLLAEAQAQERQRLENELATIDDQLRERTDLHQELVHELERELDRYQNQLQQSIKQYGSEDRRNRMKQRIRELSQELRRERRQHWHDRQQLLSERRGLRSELASLDDDLLTRFF